MTFRDLASVTDGLTEAFGRALPLTDLPLGERASMRYPALLPLMRFTARQYACPGFGNVFAMHTRAMGLMQLSTLVLTPNCGRDVPLLLIDVMRFGKKNAAFVEYYDCTAPGVTAPALSAVAEKYAALPDYAEKPAWYVGERAPYSLIKGGEDEAALLSMLSDSIEAYAASIREQTWERPENRAGLSAFIDRMLREGNPSSSTMERVLGKRGAAEFFLAAIMPKQYRDAK